MRVRSAVLRSVVVFLLLMNSRGKRRCNYTEILGTYRQLVSVQLQNLNINSSYNSSKEKSLCPAVKAHHILNSIFNATQRMRCQIGSIQTDLYKPLESMEQVIIYNCSPHYLGETLSCANVKEIKGQNKKRLHLIRMIKALVICWQKFQSAFSVK